MVHRLGHVDGWRYGSIEGLRGCCDWREKYLRTEDPGGSLQPMHFQGGPPEVHCRGSPHHLGQVVVVALRTTVLETERSDCYFNNSGQKSLDNSHSPYTFSCPLPLPVAMYLVCCDPLKLPLVVFPSCFDHSPLVFHPWRCLSTELESPLPLSSGWHWSRRVISVPESRTRGTGVPALGRH